MNMDSVHQVFVESGSNLQREGWAPVLARVEHLDLDPEDLHRFPTESLHSFSFAHQSEESLHSRQNVLKRSIDFMRDKLGWAASNPAILNAHAKLGGDQEVQSMVELLSRANLIGPDALKAHGLGSLGPLTGPADLSADNIFEKSFMPRSESPKSIDEPESPREVPGSEPAVLARASVDDEALLSPSSLESGVSARALINPPRPPAPTATRSSLKRTYTDTGPLSIQSKLHDALAQPYMSKGRAGESQIISPTTVPTVPPVPGPHPGHHPAPHGHGSRYAPAAQAIFTTEAQAPWTITAANDLACLVFGVTRAEVRKLGILEVVRPERRKWLEEKLKNPDSESPRSQGLTTQSQRTSPSPTTGLAVGSGVTARLLSKPSSRQVADKRRAQTDDGSGSTYASKKNVKSGLNHPANKSRGVLLCGDVVPIQKRNGALGSASLWVKEKRGGLIWVLEEIAEDVVYISVDEVGCVVKGEGAIEAIWGTERVRRGMDLKRLIPDIPRRTGTNTGALDYNRIAELRSFTARTQNNICIPVTVDQMSGQPTFRVSSFPHIAGIIVLSSSTLQISSSNTVFSTALFGQSQPDGLHINELIPSFDKILNVMTDEDKITLVDGIVVPEHSFRRARALLAMREGKGDAAAIFLRPSGLPAKHRDGAEIMVDVQMRVVKSERSVPKYDENVIAEDGESQHANHDGATSEVVYALWITYSRHLHAANHGIGPVPPIQSRPGTPPHQPSPGQSMNMIHPEEVDSDSARDTPSVSLLTQQLQRSPTPPEDASVDPPPELDGNGQPRRKTINDFVVLEDMGQGAYGQVKLCRYRRNSSKKVVIKYVTKRRILVDTWTRDRRLGTVPLEIHVLDYLRRDGFKHPNIVEMSDFFEDDVNYYIEMVPHGLPGMDLFDYIELRVNMDEVECRKIFVQVAEALWHLHTKAKVVHRDIKDENVILDGEGNIKLIDFGSAAYIKNGPFDVFVGTIDYAAPEVLRGSPYRGKEQDVWALGILLYTIVYKENPFYSIDEIMDHDLRVPYIMSEESIDLIRLMLNRDVDQRITISQVLEHEWCKAAKA
ncbi:serine/threonine protein kinase [Coniosporium apollinis]|uniref:Serine/threonine protein kinase n=1 Tax=Coniosporium apollinis TaxID=61459 RepID=A0ABQ9P1N2_9PEZI|nr:serine/threonine protein kinase [Coniosporium apollinis]